jgi:hypothetical protein
VSRHKKQQSASLLTCSGPLDCVVVELDIDYYKDLLSHFFVEVLPNKFTGGLTDLRVVYLLRWMAGKQGRRLSGSPISGTQ